MARGITTFEYRADEDFARWVDEVVGTRIRANPAGSYILRLPGEGSVTIVRGATLLEAARGEARRHVEREIEAFEEALTELGDNIVTLEDCMDLYAQIKKGGDEE